MCCPTRYRMYSLQLFIICCTFVCGLSIDWLVDKVETPVTFTSNSDNTMRLQNGLIFRDFITSPNFATVEFYSVDKDQSILRALNPECRIQLDDSIYNIGGVNSSLPRAYLNRTALRNSITPDKNAFQFASFETMSPKVPFHYTPKRGAPRNIQWPPKGLRVDVLFKAPLSALADHKMVKVFVHYEMYVGIPVISKWVTIDTSDAASRVVASVLFVEQLSVNEQWGSTGTTNFNENGWLYVETDQSHGTSVSWHSDPSTNYMPGSFEPDITCTYSPVPKIPLEREMLESFQVHELLIGSSDRERSSLARHRMFRTLAPHTQENPIFFHMTNSSSEAVRQVIDQMAEVGFEMMIYSFGSGFDLESTNPAYIKQLTSDIAYAKSKGIEVGGYDLIALTRKVQENWMAIDATTNSSVGSACFASGWYDHLLNQVMLFLDQTGLSMVETDGPYGGYSCASETHKYHHDVHDSIYWQQKLQGRFYTILREKEVYINQPDYFFYQGGSRTGLGYNENQYSLPRWQDISISRQGMYDDTFRLTPTAGWMFAPLVVYHGGGDAAMFEPLTEHSTVYEWALAQYLGMGTAACYRGYRLYDTNTTKAMVKKWVDFYKTYRDILTSDVVHVRRADLQSIDSFMHVNPYIENKALAMVFNPTNEHIIKNLTFPMYYAGIRDKAMVSEMGGMAKEYTVAQGMNGVGIEVSVDLPALGITWYLFKSPTVYN